MEQTAKSGESTTRRAKSIESIQVKLIKIAQKKLGLSDEEYRTILNNRYWVNSCKDLSYDEATDLIKHFQTLGFKIITRRYGRRAKSKELRAPNVIQLVSKQQLSIINHLKEDVKWHVHDGCYRWLKKYLKRDGSTGSPCHPEGSPCHPERSTERSRRSLVEGWTSLIRTSREANAVIEALKGMLRRQESRGQGVKDSSEIHSNPGTLEPSNPSAGLHRDGGMHGGRWQW